METEVEGKKLKEKDQEVGEIEIDASKAKKVETQEEEVKAEPAEEQTGEVHEDETETEEMDEDSEEIPKGLPFPEAPIVRIMKNHMDKEKMIKKEVKLEMNKWLGRVCAKVAKEMNKFPYVMMNINEFNEGKRVYEDLENFDKEKKRILAHLDAIKQDIAKLERDLGKVEDEIF